MLKLGLIASLALFFPIFLSSAWEQPSYHRKWARQAPLCPTLPTFSGGRKVGIVIDSSGSNSDTDPQDLRVAAGRQLNAALVTQAQAGPGGQSDVVTIVKFSDDATLLYPLGDPSGAIPAFNQIDADGGTSIASGLKEAIDEITKQSAGPTAGRSGVVVLTDGEDSFIDDLISELNRAQTLGIRVSFGFLSDTIPSEAQDLLAAILNTGGRYSTIESAAGQQAFVNLVILNGITGNENGSGASVLFPDVSIAGRVNSSESQTYSYNAQPGEKLNFTVSALSGQTLDLALHDIKASTDIKKSSTDADGNGVLTYDATNEIELGLVISTTNTTTGLFTIALNSSLGSAGGFSKQCNITVTPPK